jgi:hypothetical protein
MVKMNNGTGGTRVAQSGSESQPENWFFVFSTTIHGHSHSDLNSNSKVACLFVLSRLPSLLSFFALFGKLVKVSRVFTFSDLNGFLHLSFFL